MSDFSNFADGNHTFLGSWAANGNTILGDTTPIGSFSQGTGVYNFTGGDNSDSSGAEYFFLSGYLDLSGSDALALTLELLPATGTPATSLTVSIYDQNSNGAHASFQLSDFNSSTFTTSTVQWIADLNFDPSKIAYFLISGDTINGSSSVDIAVDNLAAVTVVPEPGTYAAIAGVAALGLVAWRRRRTA